MQHDELSNKEPIIRDFSKGALVWYNFRPDVSAT